MLSADEIVIELHRTLRELEARVAAKLAAQQLGEAWKGLPGYEQGQTESVEGLSRVA